MAWCRQAISHYLSQCWPRSMSPYGVTRPQWIKENAFENVVCKMSAILIRPHVLILDDSCYTCSVLFLPRWDSEYSSSGNSDSDYVAASGADDSGDGNSEEEMKAEERREAKERREKKKEKRKKEKAPRKKVRNLFMSGGVNTLWSEQNGWFSRCNFSTQNCILIQVQLKFALICQIDIFDWFR